MNSLDNIKDEHFNKDYNDIPVVYCKNCLSLRVMVLDDIDDINYCDDCGCSETCITDIASWEEMYKGKYGKPFNTK